MATINFNAFGQSTAKGKLELTPNANTFTVKISAGSDTTLTPGMAVELDSAGTGVQINVKALTQNGTIFGFVPLNHKNNGLTVTATKPEHIEVACDNCIMEMEASAAIAQGALVKYNYSTKKVATASSSGDKPCGIALQSAGADGDLLKVLIKTPVCPAVVA